MYRFISSLLLLFCISISATFSQNATLKGRVIDNSTGESIPMANVLYYKMESLLTEHLQISMDIIQ